MKALVPALCAILLLVACNDSQSLPTAPDPIWTPAHTFFGVVTTGGVPVVGANVAVTLGSTAVEVASAVTDGNGYYRIPDVTVKRSVRFQEKMFVSKPGYFMEFKYTNVSKDTQLDFALHPWVHIALDAVIRGRVGDTPCEGFGPCERFAFTPPSHGTLELTSPAFSFNLEVLKPNGLSAALFYGRPGLSSPLQLSVPVDAGVTYEIHVILPPGGSTRDFVLTTALRETGEP